MAERRRLTESDHDDPSVLDRKLKDLVAETVNHAVCFESHYFDYMRFKHPLPTISEWYWDGKCYVRLP